MRAYVVENGKYKLQNMEEKRPVGDQVIVSLKTAGLNHRDLKIKNKFNDGNQAYVLGSDGAGIIEAVGDQTSRFQIGG
ncbi:alcohol dehydrogenase [Gracilibacillus boraciitolerans JCM 21714]|uniref:Alcohol dehydrogenase n=1 Tax=Gracilibacillus boraciitolerans JCM 21714 TaxID=1298598 RepID=W4VG95_9BACI|nr:alcohol dehydrogenase [Gracilibacillus boraciitolerans JCM 21714]